MYSYQDYRRKEDQCCREDNPFYASMEEAVDCCYDRHTSNMAPSYNGHHLDPPPQQRPQKRLKGQAPYFAPREYSSLSSIFKSCDELTALPQVALMRATILKEVFG